MSRPYTVDQLLEKWAEVELHAKATVLGTMLVDASEADMVGEFAESLTDDEGTSVLEHSAEVIEAWSVAIGLLRAAK